MTNLDSILKSRDIANKGPSSQGYDFSSSHVWMWVLDYKESWVSKHWCFWTVALEKILESPLNCKEIQAVHPKGDQSWVFIGTIDAEAPVLWPPDSKKWLTGKDPDAGQDWRQEEKGMDDRWDGWVASPTRRTWVWRSSGSRWCTGRPGVLQSMWLQRVRHDWETELNYYSLLTFNPGEGNGNPLQYSCLENSKDRGAWWATVLGVAKIQTQLSNYHSASTQS